MREISLEALGTGYATWNLRKMTNLVSRNTAGWKTGTGRMSGMTSKFRQHGVGLRNIWTLPLAHWTAEQPPRNEIQITCTIRARRQLDTGDS